MGWTCVWGATVVGRIALSSTASTSQWQRNMNADTALTLTWTDTIPNLSPLCVARCSTSSFAQQGNGYRQPAEACTSILRRSPFSRTSRPLAGVPGRETSRLTGESGWNGLADEATLFGRGLLAKGLLNEPRVREMIEEATLGNYPGAGTEGVIPGACLCRLK